MKLGTITYSAEQRAWVVNAQPHVMIRLKRVFASVKAGKVGAVEISDTRSNARDLEWFLERYDLEVPERARLRARAAEQRQAESLALRIMSGEGPRRRFDLAVPAREYQKVAAELALASGGLLLADDLGLGKTASAITMLTDPTTRPAVVVTMTHLTRQWQAELARFAPAMRTHIIRSTKPYDLDKKCRHRLRADSFAPGASRCTVCGASRDDIYHGRTTGIPDVLITNYQKLAGWSDVLAAIAKGVVFDEAQELRSGLARDTPGKYLAAQSIAAASNVRLGLSVGPNSYIELRGGIFGAGWLGTIADAFMVANHVSEWEAIRDYEILTVVGVESRGWTDAGFRWKPVRRFIRHACDREVVEVFAGGVRTSMTTDHSVFVVREDGIEEAPAGALQHDDVVPVDNGAAWLSGATETPLNVLQIVRSIPRGQVVVDLSGVSRKDLGLKAWEWQNCHREAKYGARLPAEVYWANRRKLPAPSSVYVGRGKGSHLPPTFLLSRWAYVLGFFLGDGWVSGGRVCFAVESARVSDFMRELEKLGLDLRPKVRQMRGQSVEIRCTNKLFAAVIEDAFQKRRCFDKCLPGEWLVTWNEEARRELLRGLVDSDGHVARNDKKNMSYITTSRDLAHGVLALLRSLGVAGSLHVRKPTVGGVVRGRQIVGGRPSFHVTWSWFALHGSTNPRAGNRVRHHWAKTLMNQGRVRETRVVEDRPPYVYDVEMDGHPSFVVNGVLVHNTATPIYNYGAEIYSVLNVLRPDALGTFSEFATAWCDGFEDARKTRLSNPEAFGTFARSEALMLRRTRAEVGRELPQLSKFVQVVDSDPAELEKLSQGCAELAKIILRESEAERGQKMRASEELSNRLRQATGVAKAPFVAAFVRLLVESGEPVVLYGWHRQVYDIWLEKLSDLKPIMYTGTESPAQKAAARDAFIKGESKVLIMSLRAGAGLDGLQQMCRTGVFGELDWSPGVLEQCGGRLHRDGQKEPVTLYFLVAEDGADPIMTDVLGVKRWQVEGLRDPGLKPLEAMTIDPNHVKRLAEDYLARMRESAA